jgi:post-segregation antitoxin (ccd killing protein)
MPRKQTRRTKAVAEPVRGRLLKRATGPVDRIAVYLPPELARNARVRAVNERRTLSALVANALEEHLGA